jgi:hypothetical protein
MCSKIHIRGIDYAEITSTYRVWIIIDLNFVRYNGDMVTYLSGQ